MTVRDLPKGIEQHVQAILYLVDPAELIFADGGFNSKSKKLEYRNIRYALSEHKLLGAGLEKEKMLRLAERIRTEGLHQYPVCRWFNDGVQVVDGERRTRSIRKLIADNAQCWDKKTKQFVPAKELFAKIPVFVDDMDDQMALKINFSASESGEHFGDGAVIAYVKHLRQCEQTDAEIIELTGYSIEWLRQTDKLCELDDECFLALSEGKITRGLAGELLEIESEVERVTELKRRCELAVQIYQEKTTKLEKKADKAAVQLEGLTADEALLTKGINPDTSEEISAPAAEEKAIEVKEKKSKAEKKSKSADDKLAQHKETQPKAGTKTGTEPKPLNFTKIEKYWLEVVHQAIKNKGKDEEDNPLEIEFADLILTKMLCEQMRKGQRDIVRILTAHNKHKAERVAQLLKDE